MASDADRWLTFTGRSLPSTAKSPLLSQSKDGSYLALVNNKSCDILIFMGEDDDPGHRMMSEVWYSLILSPIIVY